MKTKNILEAKEFIKNKKFLKPIDLEKKLKISQSTCRRVLLILEKEGFIERKFGEIVYINQFKNNYLKDTVALKAITENIEVKKNLAKAGAKLAINYDVIFVDASSANYYLFDFLKNKEINIYTNSLINAKRAIDKEFKNVYLISGKIKQTTFSIIGDSQKLFDNIIFPLSFIGVNAINHNNDLMTPEISEGKNKHRILSKSQLAVFLVEKRKFDNNSFFNFDNEKIPKIVISDIDEWDSNDSFHLVKIKN